MKKKTITRITVLILSILFFMNIGLSKLPFGFINSGNELKAATSFDMEYDKLLFGVKCDEEGQCEFICQPNPNTKCEPWPCHYHGGDCEIIE
jgi:hypothetical protein